MPKDQTPPPPQALDPGGRGRQAQLDAGHGAYQEYPQCPEQVFAGESGDPIWETQSARRAAGAVADAVSGIPQRVPRAPENKLRPGRLIDLVQAPRPINLPPPQSQA